MYECGCGLPDLEKIWSRNYYNYNLILLIIGSVLNKIVEITKC